MRKELNKKERKEIDRLNREIGICIIGEKVEWRVTGTADEKGELAPLYAKGKVKVEDRKEAWQAAREQAKEEKEKVISQIMDGEEPDELSWGFTLNKQSEMEELETDVIDDVSEYCRAPKIVGNKRRGFGSFRDESERFKE